MQKSLQQFVRAGALLGLALVALAHVVVVHAAPRKPTDPAEVLERLPLRPTDTTARELVELRDAVRRANAVTPVDPAPATRLAERYFDLAMARGDPRYIGYADAVVKPLAGVPFAPLLVVRAQLQQYRHGFDEALALFDEALKVDPNYAAAHAWRGAIHLVRAEYTKADRECDALQTSGRVVLYAACSGMRSAYTGKLEAGYTRLQLGAKFATDAETRLWFFTRLGEVAAWRGQTRAAEQHYRDALALGLDDGYLLAAWADFLLDQKRPQEVVQWLARWEASDTLLLRLALAEHQLNLPAAITHVQALEDRFAAAKQRGDTTHRAEEARFWLALRGDVAQALQVAAANYTVQREPRDARVALEAALAARDAAPAQAVLDWLAASGFEDPQMRALAKAVAALPTASNPSAKVQP